MKVVANTRSAQGTGASRRLRRTGKVPGIVYGSSDAPVSIELDHNDLFHALRKEAFHSSILDLEVDGKAASSVLLRDVQMHPFKQQVLHIDFQRVAANEKIHVRVPLHYINAETSPAVKLSANVVSHVMNDIEVVCLPNDLPEFIEIDLGNLEAQGTVHVSDLKLPAGVTVSPQPEEVVATAIMPQLMVEQAPVEVEAAPAAAAAAPAVAAGGDKADKGEKSEKTDKR
jgi:large subunit ribosomal protein L25